MTMNLPLPAMLPAPAQTPPPKANAPSHPSSIAFVPLPTVYRKITVEEYHTMIDVGILAEGEPVELIEGRLVAKMSKNSPHETAITILIELLGSIKPSGYSLRCQSPITLSTSEPEPDFALARGTARSFKDRHPLPAEVGIILEVSESSLAYDRTTKNRMYAREGMPEYWIVNLVEMQVEVYTDPTGPVSEPVYRVRKDYTTGATVPLILDGTVVANIPVADILP